MTANPPSSPPHGLGIEMGSKDRIIVGIDFGTTHSAVGWAHTATPDEYEVITQWPGQAGKDWGKVPSDISYTVVPAAQEHQRKTSAMSLPVPERTAAELVSPIEPRRGSAAQLPSLRAITALRPASSPASAASIFSPVSPLSPTWEPAAAAATTTAAAAAPLVTYKWGFEVPPTDPGRVSWIKILLDPSLARPDFVAPKKTVLPPSKTPVLIATDYLTALRNFTLQTLTRRLGEDVVKKTPIEYILTVPAVWSDKARALTLSAAVAAGLGGDGLRLITEPEGAAEYTLRSLQPGCMKVGDCFTVCDAGGGTVDLITYGIASLAPLQLTEVAVGTGGLCGAVYLDRRFEEVVAGKIGRERFDAMGHRAKFQLREYWESYVKRQFSAEREEPFEVPVMGVPEVPEGFLRIEHSEIAAVFEPVVSQVIELLAAQVRAVFQSAGKPVGAVLLVGGFGSSEYLFQRIERWSAGSIPVMQPRNAWTAVVRGAIIRGLQGDTVKSRLSRRSYGVVHDARYDETKHSDDEKRWHELRCEWVVRNRIQWYIRRGDVTTPDQTLSFPFYRTIADRDIPSPRPSSSASASTSSSRQPRCITLKTELWTCDAEDPPDKRDSTVRKLCVMTSEPVAVDRFKKMRNEKGDIFYRVDYTLDMTVTGGAVVYEMSLEGKDGAREKVGRVEVTYE